MPVRVLSEKDCFSLNERYQFSPDRPVCKDVCLQQNKWIGPKSDRQPRQVRRYRETNVLLTHLQSFKVKATHNNKV